MCPAQASFQPKMPPTDTILGNPRLCSLICIPTVVLWIPKEAELRRHFDSSPFWGTQDSSGQVATSDCVCSSFQCN